MERSKLELEFIFKASPTILYKFFTTPACLVRWFCDEVDIQGEEFTFVWSGSAEVADLVEDVENENVKFRWQDSDDDDEYLQFNINTSPVTGETILLLTDYCDDDEVEDQTRYWSNQMDRLRKATGG